MSTGELSTNDPKRAALDRNEIDCPSCGKPSYFSSLDRDASEFCRHCDFPLFWAPTEAINNVVADGDDAGLGFKPRYPGTVGFAGRAKIACPKCSEPNPATDDENAVCIRCNARLFSGPVVFEEEPLGWALALRIDDPQDVIDDTVYEVAPPAPSPWIVVALVAALIAAIALWAWIVVR